MKLKQSRNYAFFISLLLALYRYWPIWTKLLVLAMIRVLSLLPSLRRIFISSNNSDPKILQILFWHFIKAKLLLLVLNFTNLFKLPRVILYQHNIVHVINWLCIKYHFPSVYISEWKEVFLGILHGGGSSFFCHNFDGKVFRYGISRTAFFRIYWKQKFSSRRFFIIYWLVYSRV